MRPVAHLEGQEPTIEGVGMPANASVSSDPASAGSVADAAGSDGGDGEPGEHPDAAILGQALSWWLAVDQLADRALAQISATLGVPNPDVDTDLDLPPLPAGVAGLSQVLGMFTSADTVVDGAQVVLAKACGIPNPDPDADDGGDEPDGDDGPTAHADSPPVTATTAPAGATDPPDTGAAADDWSAITAHLTTASPDPADVLTALRGAFL